MTTTWIKQRYSPSPPEGSGLLVMGSRWMLEMFRFDDEPRSLGLFLAAFGVIQLNDAELRDGEFVGYSTPGKPPADWLISSMMFDLGATPLAKTPEELIALVEKPRPGKSIEAGLHASPLSRKLKRRIIDTYHDGVSISDIARELRVSHAHLTRQFKRDFGLTPVGYRHHLRVREAVERLSLGQKALDVGYEVGFNDTGRFYQDFRKVTGTSPGKCVDLIKKRQDSNRAR
ncbi:MAG TPA: AraC family transcriptional regulator [Terriglobia bacterium]|nr:AraC family transcriptional regulator [Terriglobia bacterium]